MQLSFKQGIPPIGIDHNKFLLLLFKAQKLVMKMLLGNVLNAHHWVFRSVTAPPHNGVIYSRKSDTMWFQSGLTGYKE